MTIVELKKEYNKLLNIVKDDNNGKTVRIEALNTLTKVYKDILVEEPKCTIMKPTEIHDKFISGLETPDVVWYTENDIKQYDQKFIDQTINTLEGIRLVAYLWVRKNHPKLDDQSDKFGQIVNARMHLIIANRQ